MESASVVRLSLCVSQDTHVRISSSFGSQEYTVFRQAGTAGVPSSVFVPKTHTHREVEPPSSSPGQHPAS